METQEIYKHQKHRTARRTFVQKTVNCFERIVSLFRTTQLDEDKETKVKLLELLKPIRYKPLQVKKIAMKTKFSVSEVKYLYRTFKQECPTGISSEENFKEIYQKIFPLGDSSKYAHLVFISIDRDRTGGITFGDFMEFLSVITRGSTLDKIEWSFEFYDVNRDGVISRDEMTKVNENCKELKSFI